MKANANEKSKHKCRTRAVWGPLVWSHLSYHQCIFSIACINLIVISYFVLTIIRVSSHLLRSPFNLSQACPRLSPSLSSSLLPSEAIILKACQYDQSAEQNDQLTE